MVVIGTLQQTPQERLDADNLEVLSAHRVSPDRTGDTVGLQTETPYGHRGNGRKHCIAIAHIAHFGIGKNWIGLIGARQRHYPVWIGHINGPQDQRLQYAEDDDIGGNPERQGQHGGDAQSRENGVSGEGRIAGPAAGFSLGGLRLTMWLDSYTGNSEAKVRCKASL